MTHQKKPTILIVDDQAPIRAVHRRILSVLDADIVEASGGYDAIDAVRKQEFAVALLDVRMPEMDGFELASMIRREANGATTPIIFITAAEWDADMVKAAYRLGAVDFLASEKTGPVDGEIIRHKARMFLDLFKARVQLEERLAAAEAKVAEAGEQGEQFRSKIEEIRQQGLHDHLSGLPNRTLFEDRLEGAIRRSQRSRQSFALAFVDLDRFKPINDQYGHVAGDELLVTIARRLKEGVRSTDTIARVGGDEFAVICEGLESEAGAEYIAEKLVQAVRTPIMLTSTSKGGPAEVEVGVSIGIALFPGHAKTRDEVLMRSDHAMYTVKRAGGGVRIYRDTDTTNALTPEDRVVQLRPETH